MSRRKFYVADLMAGGGGFTDAALQVLNDRGYEVEMVAVNHWDIAIATQELNHPGIRTVCQDIELAKPRDLVPGGRLDLIIAAPECTHHSRARGGRPMNDQSRSTAWCVVRWCTDLRVRSIIVENVPEFVEWGPLDPRTDRPVQSRKAEYFRAWVRSLEGLGYKVEWRVLCAADYGAATTRERFFLLARSDRKPIVWPRPTHARPDAYPRLFDVGLKPWRPARDVIDWTLRGRSIFNRPRPLARNTIARIHTGALRVGWPQPFILMLRNHMDGRSLDAPLAAIAASGNHAALVQPIVLPLNQGHGRARGIRGADEPLHTLTGTESLAVAEPIILPQHGGGVARPTSAPLATIAADGAQALVVPCYGTGVARTAVEPLATATAKDRHALVLPVTHGRDGSARARSDANPFPTITGAHRGELALVTADGLAWDILLRMLQPHELASGMGFPSWYRFVGTKEQQVKQIGNAVEGNVAKALIGSSVDAMREAA